jgi:predicted component of type VI protein secretion system
VDYEIFAEIQMEYANGASRWVDYEHPTRDHLILRTPAHEAALHTARLRLELSQSRAEQNDYLRNVELARVLDKRAKKIAGRKTPPADHDDPQLDAVLSKMF